MIKSKNIKYEITLLGGSSDGKTCIFLTKFKEQFNLEQMIMTVGIDYKIDRVKIGDKDYFFKIYDTPGQWRYKSISSTTISKSDGILIIFDVTNEDSLKDIDYWLKEIEKYKNKKKIIFLVGNKIDLIEERKISYEEALNIANINKIKYFETSVKSRERIEEVFNEMYTDIIESNKNRK